MKRIFLFAVVFLFIATVVAILFLNPTPRKRQPITIPTPIPVQPIVKPTTLKLLTTAPPEDPLDRRLPIQQIAFVFNEPVSPGGFFYSIDPFVETIVRQEDSSYTIILSAKGVWTEGTTTISILPTTQSTKGNRLNLTYKYKLLTGYPKNIHPDNQGY